MPACILSDILHELQSSNSYWRQLDKKVFETLQIHVANTLSFPDNIKDLANIWEHETSGFSKKKTMKLFTS